MLSGNRSAKQQLGGWSAPQLLEYAFSKNIILTFPTSLLAILNGLAMTIQQAEIAKNIDEIQAQAVELRENWP